MGHGCYRKPNLFYVLFPFIAAGICITEDTVTVSGHSILKWLTYIMKLHKTYVHKYNFAGSPI